MKICLRYFAILMTAGCVLSACGSSGGEGEGSGGNTGSGGSASGGASASGGVTGSGGKGSGGVTGSGGVSTGGMTGTSSGGVTGSGGKGSGGVSASGGTGTASGGVTGSGGQGMAGSGPGATGGHATGSGGHGGATTASGGSTGTAGSSGSGGSPGTAGTGGDFNPCPTNGDPCKVLPLGDSITWGINYGGGYRIKLFAHAATDQKNMTYVGYDTMNPPSSAALSALGSASSKYVNKHEGHSGWTIQQDDDLVTGKSTANNDGVTYTGKKVVADFNPNIVLVHLGTNDMYMNPTGADTRLGTLIDHIVADAPDALVVVAKIIPLPSSAPAVTTFNAAIPGVVQQRASAGKHVILVDQFTGFMNSDFGDSAMVHPNEGGYEKMAVVWYNAIKSYLH